MGETTASFVRWQAITREHLSRVSDLVLGLSSGAVAFLGNLLLDGRSHAPCAETFALAAFVVAGLSVLVGLWAAVNRLKDFRRTTTIARRRESGATDADLEADRTVVHELGMTTWLLFRAQLVLFGVSAVALTVFVMPKR